MERERDVTITLCSALFQASVLLEFAYPIGSNERAIADLCRQASAAIEELESDIFALRKRLRPTLITAHEPVRR